MTWNSTSLLLMLEKKNIFTTLNLFSLTTSLQQLLYRIIRHNYENKCWPEKLMPEVKIRILGWEGNTEAFCYQITNSICILIRKTAHESKIQLKNYILLVKTLKIIWIDLEKVSIMNQLKRLNYHKNVSKE